MFEPLYAAADLSDWVEILVVVLVIAGSAIGKIAQWLIQYFNKAQEDRSSRTLGKESMRPGAARSDRPVARPMPGAPEQRRPQISFGEDSRRPRPDAAQPPPFASMPDVLNDALGEVFARIGVPKDARPGTRGAGVPPERPSHRTPPGPRERRSVTVRTTRAPISRPSASKKKSARPVSPPPSPPRAESTDSSPAHAEEHLGHLQSGVEARENAIGHITDHVGQLQPHILAEIGRPAARSTGGIRSLLGLQDRSAVRRAILLSELLGPPLSLRDPD